MAEETYTIIENNTARNIHLPKTTSWEKGIWLEGGSRCRVPNEYLEELRAHKTEKCDRKGKVKGERSPGVELLKDLSETKVLIHEGLQGNAKYGPQITIYKPDQVTDDLQLGPRLPDSLQGYSEKGALEILKRTSAPKETLALWSKDPRKVVASAVKAKMAGG